MNQYKGYSLFNDTENKALQAWNRTAAMFNIASDVGPQEATKYADHMDDKGKIAMKETLRMIRENGYDAVRKTVNGGI